MPDEIIPQTTLRETLEANVEAAEAGVLETPEQVRVRDEAGRFAKAEIPVDAKPVVQPQIEAQPAPQTLQRPTTWKKDYLPIWDKLSNGLPLNAQEAKKLAEYTNQRENEYKTGVSTYKNEAMQAKELQDAITPFLPDLQQTGMKPAQWIQRLGQVNTVLMKGTPQQKLQMLQVLAQQYGVPLAAAGQPNQVVQQLVGIIGDLRNQMGGMTQWKQTIESKVVENETKKLQGEVEAMQRDTAKHPHFEAVREQMAQLLETGLAPDLNAAYEQAIYLNPEVRQQLLTAAQQPRAGQIAAQARAKAVSPKSSTPSGQVKTGEAKDRRSQIADAVDAAEASMGGRV